MTEVQVERRPRAGHAGYRRFLEEAPESALTPEAMRRLADLKLEKEYGIPRWRRGPVALRRPRPRRRPSTAPTGVRRAASLRRPATTRVRRGLRAARGRRARGPIACGNEPVDVTICRAVARASRAGSARGDRALRRDPRGLSRTTSTTTACSTRRRAPTTSWGAADEAIAVIEELIARYPGLARTSTRSSSAGPSTSSRGRRYLDAEEAYARSRIGARLSEFYELALYKLGWTLYKQELHAEALDQYVGPARSQGRHRVRLRPDRRTRATGAGSRTPSVSSA